MLVFVSFIYYIKKFGGFINHLSNFFELFICWVHFKAIRSRSCPFILYKDGNDQNKVTGYSVHQMNPFNGFCIRNRHFIFCRPLLLILVLAHRYIKKSVTGNAFSNIHTNRNPHKSATFSRTFTLSTQALHRRQLQLLPARCRYHHHVLPSNTAIVLTHFRQKLMHIPARVNQVRDVTWRSEVGSVHTRTRAHAADDGFVCTYSLH